MKMSYAKSLLPVVGVMLYIGVYANAQTDERFDRYNVAAEDRPYIRELNENFDSGSQGEFPLPPVNAATYAASTNSLLIISFGNAPLEQVTDFYSRLSGLTVVPDDGVNTLISYIGHRRFTYDEALRILARVFSDNNLALTKTDETTVRLHWKE